jgi:predicted O-linked N-acetylglucosamine transferase (SPINDLY family)
MIQPGPALAQLEQALREDPDNHELFKNLGNACRAAGDLEKAVDCYRRALEIDPAYLPARYNLGLVLHQIGRLDEAEECFRRLAAVDPGDKDALVHLGSILCKQSRFEEGAETLRKALHLAPDDANLWIILANACQQLGDTRQAVEAYGRALELEPDSVDAAIELAGVLLNEGDVDQAIERYRAAIRVRPDFAASHNALGCALAQLGRVGEADESLRMAVGLQPDHADAHHNLGNLRRMLGARLEALRCFEEASRLRPGDPTILEAVLCEKQAMCDWEGFEELSGMRRRGVFERSVRPVNPFSLLTIPSTRAEQLQCARNFAQEQVRAVARTRLPFKFDCRRGGKLRIGYLSADFHAHATAYLMAELFELHDRRRFEIMAYSFGPDDGSAMRARLKRAFDRFSDIGPMSHAAAASAIHAAGTDILIDLKGYTENARTGIAALRPAPVLVSYLGYPGTMGAEFIDYLIADRFIVPAAHAADYSEKLVLLPGSYQVNDRQRPVAPTPPRRELSLPEEGFVFCCFNSAYKILPETFSVWMRLLQGAAGSVLWLLESNPWVGQNLRREAQLRGVDPQRLVFAPTLAPDRHLGRVAAADLFLDTLPCNAHTSASDALWTGLPVLTAPGETFASRVAGSLLAAVGMPELIAGSMAEYEALALKLAREPGRLAALRAKLARNRDKAPLFDTPCFARGLESAYEIMWQHYLSGGGPRAIEL